MGMGFGREYFEKMNYSSRGSIIRRFGVKVLTWASKRIGRNLFNGRGKRALDIGCSFGYITSLLKQARYETYGLDISKYALREAIRRNADVFFLRHDVQRSLPFVGRTFDLITCFDVLEHLDDPLKTLKSMYRACKGIIICTTPHRLLDKPIRRLVKDYDDTHKNLRTPGEWRRIFIEEMGLSPSKVLIESYYEVPICISNRLLAFKSIRIPKLGLNTRILIRT
ncbi:class I SAM-dependent methyltransferase [Candidatus Bathyarchaeota archaeon]|nr:MAG: class I SAM-dependent methyltransferase [Candidatus Bathyarchaeota archaeon]